MIVTCYEYGCLLYFFIVLQAHVNTQLGVGCHWWFNYPGPLLDAEFEFACLSGYVRLVAFALYWLDSAQPADLTR